MHGTCRLSARYADFEHGKNKKPKGGPLEIEIFFVEGGWRGVRSLLKPSFAFLFTKN